MIRAEDINFTYVHEEPGMISNQMVFKMKIMIFFIKHHLWYDFDFSFVNQFNNLVVTILKKKNKIK